MGEGRPGFGAFVPREERREFNPFRAAEGPDLSLAGDLSTPVAAARSVQVIHAARPLHPVPLGINLLLPNTHTAPRVT